MHAAGQATALRERVVMHQPYELYERLRTEGPAREVIMPHGVKMWMVTRYEDVRAILADPRISKDGRRINELFARHSGMVAEPAAYDDELSAHMLNSESAAARAAAQAGEQGIHHAPDRKAAPSSPSRCRSR